MLMLSTLHNLLSQVLSLPMLHTAILLTPTGDLVSVASDPSRPKDEVRIIAGLAGELWQETRDQGYGMVDSEVIYAQRDKESILTHRNKLGRIVVLPVEEVTSDLEGSSSDNMEPPLLLTLNSSDNVSWDELETKACVYSDNVTDFC